MNKRFGNIGFALALNAILLLVCWPLLQQSVVASPPLANSGPDDAPSVTNDDITFLHEIWQNAWGLDFFPNQSGMTISPIVDGEWLVLVSDAGAEENPFVAQGIFIESGPAQYFVSWDQDLLDEAGLLSVDHYSISGTLYGSTGWEGQIDAITTEVVAPGENPGDDSVFVQTLTPVEVGGEPDAPDAPDAPDLLSRLLSWSSSQDGGAQQASAQTQLTPAQCQAIWNLQRAACEAKYHSDRRTCALITAGCFLGCGVICSATTFGYALCLAICLAGCLAYEAGCLNDANGAYAACVAAADAARMACEPGWTPPAVN